jgi:hypothetical protein
MNQRYQSLVKITVLPQLSSISDSIIIISHYSICPAKRGANHSYRNITPQIVKYIMFAI